MTPTKMKATERQGDAVMTLSFTGSLPDATKTPILPAMPIE